MSEAPEEIPHILRKDAPQTPHDILRGMARTFEERNRVYGDNYRMVGQVMKALFPNGITLLSSDDYDVYHLFELKIVKLTRFAISGLSHRDSIHDDAVYSAMIESLLTEKGEAWKINL